ncbi:MAG: hypothetical protein R3D02_13650 [Hyphomicrobiales bacterium]
MAWQELLGRPMMQRPRASSNLRRIGLFAAFGAMAGPLVADFGLVIFAVILARGMATNSDLSPFAGILSSTIGALVGIAVGIILARRQRA